MTRLHPIFGLTLAQAGLLQSGIPDSPQRTAPPDESGDRPFGELTVREQLDVCETVARREPYMSALTEALPESKQYASLLHMALDHCCPDRVVGQLVRQIIIDYFESVAAERGDDLADLT